MTTIPTTYEARRRTYDKLRAFHAELDLTLDPLVDETLFEIVPALLDKHFTKAQAATVMLAIMACGGGKVLEDYLTEWLADPANAEDE